MTNRLEDLPTRVDPGQEATAFGPEAHGVADWPFGAPPVAMSAWPLPGLRTWPRIHILVLADQKIWGLAATRASIVGQVYPHLRCDVVDRDTEAGARLADLLANSETDAVMLLRPGDMLAPGALAALGLEMALTGAEIVAGLRLVFGTKPLGLDAVAAPPGPLGDPAPPQGTLAPFTGAEMLLARTCVQAAGGLDPQAPHPVAALWPRLVGRGARLARVGRPVLLQHAPDDNVPPMPPGLSVAMLTDRGYSGGAGIAHKRLADALALGGHRVAHLTLGSESPAAAAEWTERFPRAEADIATGGYDLILAGNLHGATRSTRILKRLGRHAPVAAVLHDLFPLTGRCAFPEDCPVIARGCDARCPSPDAYPQLAPDRIAQAHADKRAVLVGTNAPLLLANSHWTGTIARQLAPDGTRIGRVDLAFPTGVFRPGDRAALRRELGLPPDAVLIMFAAVIADAPGKGAADLAAVLARIAGPGIGFVAVGRLDDPGAFGLAGLVSAGPIGDEDTLARWYGACDLYVTASRNETLGQTPVEAALCGTPTVAYRSTGLTTAVIDGISGRLTDPNPAALEAALRDLIGDPAERRRLGALGRIAMEGRASHAAALLRLNDALVADDLLPPGTGRLRFAPDLLGQFAMARERTPGRSGTVPGPSPAAIRAARRLKQALLGRGMPLWLRRGLYAGVRLRSWMRGGSPRGSR